MSLFDITKHARNYHRVPTIKQKEYALQLGIDTNHFSFSTLSVAIEEAKEERFERWKKAYNELDADLQRSGDILALAEKVSSLKKNGRGYCGPCPECTIGKNEDRFIVNTDKNTFWCRQCGFKGGLAQLAAYVWKCTAWDAIDSLSGQSPRKERIRARAAQVTRKERREEEKPYHDFSSVCRSSITHLAHVGQAGRDYLAQRGITEDAWLANRVGFCEDFKRGLAVCFPHELVIDGKMQIISLNRRFLDDEKQKAEAEKAKKEGRKYKPSKSKHVNGGRWGLYRLATTEGARALIVVEGEINALSVWQIVRASGWLIDVISVGSEGAFRKLAAHIEKAAQPYGKLIIWADKAKVADDASRLISHEQVKALRSPTDGKELDANDLLAKNILAGFLERVLPTGLLVEDTPPLRVTESQYREWLATPADNDLAEQLRRDLLTTERAYWHLPDTPTMRTDTMRTDTMRTDTMRTDTDTMRTDTDTMRTDTDTMRTDTMRTDTDTMRTDTMRTDTMRTDDTGTMRTADTGIRTTDGTLPMAPVDDTDDAALWAKYAAEGGTMPEGGTDGHTSEETASDELLYLCAELCERADNKEQAEAWYLEAEEHYMRGDATSLFECVQAIQAVLRGKPTSFPALPPTPTMPTDFDEPTAFDQWIWAARAVQAGHTGYLGEAWAWARKIEDDDLREHALTFFETAICYWQRRPA